MKTKHSTPTRSKSARHNGNADNDINKPKKYEALLFWTQHNRAIVAIAARSLEVAKEKANAISSEDVEDWNAFDGELYVDSVRLVEGGQDDD